jgi:catechol 2,3-dioxygenase-like lactoylglutathione lyase family enzyme
MARYPEGVGAVKNLAEVVLVVDDVDRSIRFYRDVLGLEVFSPPRLATKFLRIGGAAGGVPQQIVLVPRAASAGGERVKVLHHIGLEVAQDDFESERQRLQAAGFELRTGQHPFLPVEAFYLDDPDGNEIEIATWRGQP